MQQQQSGEQPQTVKGEDFGSRTELMQVTSRDSTKHAISEISPLDELMKENLQLGESFSCDSDNQQDEFDIFGSPKRIQLADAAVLSEELQQVQQQKQLDNAPHSREEWDALFDRVQKWLDDCTDNREVCPDEVGKLDYSQIRRSFCLFKHSSQTVNADNEIEGEEMENSSLKSRGKSFQPFNMQGSTLFEKRRSKNMTPVSMQNSDSQASDQSKDPKLIKNMPRTASLPIVNFNKHSETQESLDLDQIIESFAREDESLSNTQSGSLIENTRYRHSSPHY